MKDCPIGLICGDFECNRDGYCQDLADPWPLPYDIDPSWMPGVGLLVTLPAYDWYCPNIEHMIIQNERYNRWVGRVREDYWLGGWWGATDLPYQSHPEGGILVIYHLKLDEEITFSRPWRYLPNISYDCSPTHWEEFMPAVPIDGYLHPLSDRHIESDGFCCDWLLLWAHDFESENDDD
ncbi:hypothetical protein [Nostoc sp.]|uniref:hypothetical protein n=1 Tax=Nostoc sp. TaxID=1180 RepID=UPI002FF489AE